MTLLWISYWTFWGIKLITHTWQPCVELSKSLQPKFLSSPIILIVDCIASILAACSWVSHSSYFPTYRWALYNQCRTLLKVSLARSAPFNWRDRPTVEYGEIVWFARGIETKNQRDRNWEWWTTEVLLYIIFITIKVIILPNTPWLCSELSANLKPEPFANGKCRDHIIDMN